MLVFGVVMPAETEDYQLSPWYVFEIIEVDGQEVRQRYPHSFLTQEVAEAFMQNRKAQEAWKDAKFELVQEAYNKPVPAEAETFDKD